MRFMLGCNYWDSAHASEMWKHFSEDTVRGDMEALSRLGIRYLRVFPNWRDFQPVKRLYRWGNQPADCVHADTERPLSDPTGVDPEMIAHFRRFAGICAEYGISLMVSVVTGWMSGRVFVPPILDGRNLITDPEALMWTGRFIRGFVSGVKDLPNIFMWDLGNECNCLSPAPSRAAAYAWTSFVRSAIRAEDPTRPIASGMHGLGAGDDAVWNIADQGELTDFVTTHPYVSPSVSNDFDPADRLRSTLYPTVQSMYYQDIGGKPVIMQEQGSFTDTTANPEMAAAFARVNILSCIAHNIQGHMWWCAHEHIEMDLPPYTWSMMERSLGILDLERKPKRVGLELQRMAAFLDELPFDELSPHVTDAVCVLTQNDRWANGSVCFALAKQAGLDVRFTVGDACDVVLPPSPMYFVPGVEKWAVMYKHTWESLKSQVYDDGATMLISYDGGSLIETESVLGLRPLGNLQTRTGHVAHFPFGDLPYRVTYELRLESAGAEILAVNETGNPVFTCHRCGKGKVYFLNMPLEKNLSSTADAYTDTDWYRIYRMAAADVLSKRPVVSENPQIGFTLHPQDDDSCIVCAINYDNRPQHTAFTLAEGWELSPLYGDPEIIEGCSGAFFRAVRSRSMQGGIPCPQMSCPTSCLPPQSTKPTPAIPSMYGTVPIPWAKRPSFPLSPPPVGRCWPVPCASSAPKTVGRSSGRISAA